MIDFSFFFSFMGKFDGGTKAKFKYKDKNLPSKKKNEEIVNVYRYILVYSSRYKI